MAARYKRLEASAVPLLGLLIALFTLVCTLLNWYRMRALRQGFEEVFGSARLPLPEATI